MTAVTIAERTAAYQDAARQVHDIELSGRPEAERLEEVTRVLTALAKRTELFPPQAFPRAPGSAGGLFKLAQFPDGVGSLYVSLGFTGRGGTGGPHTHAAWAAVVGISGGVETNWLYDRVDDGSVDGEAELRLREEVVVGPGDAVVIPTGVFHTIEVISDTPVLHIHAYGRAVETQGFQLPVFATAESRTYSRRPSGAFQPPLAAVDLADVRREAHDGQVAVVGLPSGGHDLAGPFVVAATASTAATTLAGACANRDLPVVLVGATEDAQAAAAALYADGRTVVFHLEARRAAQAA